MCDNSCILLESTDLGETLHDVSVRKTGTLSNQQTNRKNIAAVSK